MKDNRSGYRCEAKHGLVTLGTLGTSQEIFGLGGADGALLLILIGP